jgi:predicted DCC family thiol-disulfide oxidoreductase YuxK
MKTPRPLPDPCARPGADIVIFDGFCRFCTAQIRLLHRLDRFESLAFLSLHDERSDRLLPEMSFDEKMQAMVVLDQERRRHRGAAAVRYLSRRLPLLWPAAPLLHIPGSLPLWERLYDLVARSRYRFGHMDCDGGTCHLHGFGKAR